MFGELGVDVECEFLKFIKFTYNQVSIVQQGAKILHQLVRPIQVRGCYRIHQTLTVIRKEPINSIYDVSSILSENLVVRYFTAYSNES